MMKSWKVVGSGVLDCDIMANHQVLREFISTLIETKSRRWATIPSAPFVDPYTRESLHYPPHWPEDLGDGGGVSSKRMHWQGSHHS